MKNKRFLIIIIAIFTSLNFYSQTDSNKLFIWEAKSKTNKIYLLGSIHMATEDIYPLNTKIENAYNESDYLVVEANILDLDQTKIQQSVITYGMYTDKNDLKTSLPEELYSNLTTTATELGLNELVIKKMKPWLAAMTISALYLAKLGYQGDLGIDYYFLKKASGQNKNILELESFDFQLRMLYDLPDEAQILYLESVLKDLSETDDSVSHIIEYWKNGDSDQMEKMLFTVYNDNKFKILYDKFFTERNINMSSIIEDYLKDDKTYFIVVGAGHLVGKDGIIETLIKKGYEVNQITK